jgi:phage terminase large subunit-like protein
MIFSDDGRAMDIDHDQPLEGVYDHGRMHHAGSYPEPEDHRARYMPDLDRTTQGSPDRVDALVWGLSKVMLKPPRRVSTSHQG